MAVDNGKSSHWLGVRDLTQLNSCMLYAKIKAEFRNRGINQIGYGCSHLHSGTREIRLVVSVYICSTLNLKSSCKQSEITSWFQTLICCRSSRREMRYSRLNVERFTKNFQKFGSPGCPTSGSPWIWRLILWASWHFTLLLLAHPLENVFYRSMQSWNPS